jgi:hypothetical protein
MLYRLPEPDFYQSLEMKAKFSPLEIHLLQVEHQCTSCVPPTIVTIVRKSRKEKKTLVSHKSNLSSPLVDVRTCIAK